MPDSRRWLLLSKPLRPPFRDGTTVLARTLMRGLPVDQPMAYFGDPNAPLRPARGDRIIGASSMGYAPGWLAKVRTLASVFDPRHRFEGVHGFFSPSPATTRVLASLRRMTPGRPVILTVTASSGTEASVRHLGALHAVVVASEHAREVLGRAGLDSANVYVIPPGVELPPRQTGPRPPRLLYAGDLDVPTARRLIATAAILERPELCGWSLTIAARPKGPAHGEASTMLHAALHEARARGRVTLVGEHADMPALLAQTGLQLFVADHVARKVDLPLVLLEGLAAGVPLCSLDFAPVNEIFARASRHGLRPGVAVRTNDGAGFARRVAEAMVDREALLGWAVDARRLAELEFSAEAMVARYRTLYREIGDVCRAHQQPQLLRRILGQLRPGS